jgi:hypothetical protein
MSNSQLHMSEVRHYTIKFEDEYVKWIRFLTLLEYQVIDQSLFPINDQEVPHKMFQLQRQMLPEQIELNFYNENSSIDLLHIVFDRPIESMLNVRLNHIYRELHF